MANECIFCKIDKGEIPSYTVYEDDYVRAFLDITQGTKGHTLIIPKKHVKNIYDIDQETINHVFSVVPKVARALQKAFNPIGLNIVNNNDEPLQSVFHFHVHLIPRYKDDGMVLKTDNNYGKISTETFNNLVAKIKENL
ncbi:MAG: HIT family protein [Candidatus Izemoplasma sp.]|nr:HIT family protein [Candidatus Izemoplasma sp.]